MRVVPMFGERVARLTGLEPATPGVTGRYSNQLSYNRVSRRIRDRPAPSSAISAPGADGRGVAAMQPMRPRMPTGMLDGAPASPRPQRNGPDRPMRILITNDDGINAPGLAALAEIAAAVAGPEGEVWTVAPAFEQSGVAHASPTPIPR
jgi:hypothetical protein